ncbi:DUF5343 domain-containing protein [Alcanivorax sp. JB21]|uniref:DUF5343 domain-containing protein n=1 Tax=Alcanivorax limicola TaxID=2874102 RepID=UPI001CBFEB60|nr:DUF5343 domain-containing protein [Alcanivorax limicola]MBZ2189397.1 DUF5343 domain-containing protein [Alcanivorax limicola]
MASLPYVTAPGNVTKALNGIAAAATPDRISQDFVKEILKIPSGSGNQMAAYLKKIGMAGTDGTPTAIYKKYRNPATRGEAAAAMLRHGYAELYRRNEYVHELTETKLKGLIIEVTGQEHDSATVTYTASCIKNIKAFADFSSPGVKVGAGDNNDAETMRGQVSTVGHAPLPPSQNQGVGLNLGYTINLNLPATSDISVFNAIFKSLKENLLGDGNE